MKRRALIAGLGGVILATAVKPLPSTAQTRGRLRRLALMLTYREGDPESVERIAVIRQALATAGWEEGRNLQIDIRYAAGDSARVQEIANELVALAPDIIVVNGTQGVRALKALTGSIPIVFVVVSDPIGQGFVQSLSHPGANITGFATYEPEIVGKWLELLHTAKPEIEYAGVLLDPDFGSAAALTQTVERIAPHFKSKIDVVHAKASADFEQVIKGFARRPNGGMVITPSPVNSVNRARIIAAVAAHKLPAVWPFGFHARDGGLIAYGYDPTHLFRLSAGYVAKILAGTAPSELPVQLPTRFELVINLKAAAAIGLTLSPMLLARADEVIE
jgi:putative tryptophan/tyrosine transport system substrate-binding protein